MNDLTLAICAYNAERYLEETLRCISEQSFRQFDLLILDDASTDGTCAVVEEYFRRNPGPHELIRSPENRGLAAGRRFIEERSATRYLVFVDADDCPHPDFLRKLYEKITSDGDLMAVGCYLEFMDQDGEKAAGGQFLGDVTKEAFHERARKNKLIFLASNAMFDREAALAAGGRAVDGFPPGKPRYQDLCEDLDLWTRMSDFHTQGKAIVVVPEVLMKYRKHDRGLSAGSFNMLLRMRHVKTNLLRRRAHQPELSFTEFQESLTETEMKRLKHEAGAADTLRKGFFLLKRGRLFQAAPLLLRTLFLNPGYLWQKVKSNSGLFKK